MAAPECSSRSGAAGGGAGIEETRERDSAYGKCLGVKEARKSRLYADSRLQSHENEGFKGRSRDLFYSRHAAE